MELNESPVAVFFDNLQVVHTKGPLIEETHYYPFGLSMKGISSQSFNPNSPINRKLFNDGSELVSEFDLSLYETIYRTLDPQLGRFLQIDPLADLVNDASPFAYVLNSPLLFNDPLGLDTTRGNSPKIDPTGGDIWVPDDGSVNIFDAERGWTVIQAMEEVVVTAHKKEEPNETAQTFTWAVGLGLNMGETVRQIHGYHIFNSSVQNVEGYLKNGKFLHIGNKKVYKQTFYGNQYVSSSSVKSSLSTAKFVKNFGRGISILSVRQHQLSDTPIAKNPMRTKRD